jgi:hypothetical protein
MTKMCSKPIDCENAQFDLAINKIIDELLAKHAKVIHNHIKRFLDLGGELTSLSLSQHADGTLILRSNERTIVTVRITVEGRKLGGAEFKVLSEPSEY